MDKYCEILCQNERACPPNWLTGERGWNLPEKLTNVTDEQFVQRPLRGIRAIFLLLLDLVSILQELFSWYDFMQSLL